MTKTAVLSLLALALNITTSAMAAPSSLTAALTCEPAQKRLAYDCTLKMTDRTSDQPVDGLTIQIKADMPSMPMAHNIPPVQAKRGGLEGVYEFPITLDMYGQWAFSIRILGPRRDMLVEFLDFQAAPGEDPGAVHHGADHGGSSDHKMH